MLHKLADLMYESFGLDRRIEAYRGTRPITLYSWDLDCIEAVLFTALKDPAEAEITTAPELLALQRLDERFQELFKAREHDA